MLHDPPLSHPAGGNRSCHDSDPGGPGGPVGPGGTEV